MPRGPQGEVVAARHVRAAALAQVAHDVQVAVEARVAEGVATPGLGAGPVEPDLLEQEANGGQAAAAAGHAQRAVAVGGRLGRRQAQHLVQAPGAGQFVGRRGGAGLLVRPGQR